MRRWPCWGGWGGVVPRLHREDHAGRERLVEECGITHRQADVVAEEGCGLHVWLFVIGDGVVGHLFELVEGHPGTHGRDDRSSRAVADLQLLPLDVAEPPARREGAPDITYVAVDLAPHVENDQVAVAERTVAAVVVGGEDAPRPQAVGTGLDDGGEGDRLSPEGPAGALELALQRALVHAGANAAGGGANPRHGRVGGGPHALDLSRGLDHAETGDDLEGVDQPGLRVVGLEALDKRGGGVEGPDQGCRRARHRPGCSGVDPQRCAFVRLPDHVM